MSEDRQYEYCYVVHSFYGCESGCCGHVVYARRKNGELESSSTQFTHPYGDEREQFAKDLAYDFFPNVPLDYSRREISDD